VKYLRTLIIIPYFELSTNINDTEMKTNKMHFRVDTVALLHEIVDHALLPSQGVLRIPINTFRVLLAKVAERCIELHDPILDRLMFDLNLYELPAPTSKEYGKLMKKVYSRADKFKKAKPCTH
jgi:hypothetical protein